MTPDERRRRKAELEHRIEQQRVDLLVLADQWQSAGSFLDASWQRLVRYRVPLLALSGVLLYRGMRRPGALPRLAQRLSTAAVIYKAAKRVIS